MSGGEDLYNPPFLSTYGSLLASHSRQRLEEPAVEVLDLPLVDLSLLDHPDAAERARCREAIARASSEWGFLQVVGHGVPQDLLHRMHREQMKVFHQPFEEKAKGRVSDFPPNSYRWGVPTATCLEQLSWSEVYHIPLNAAPPHAGVAGGNSILRDTIEEFTAALYVQAHRLAKILAEHVGDAGTYFRDNCTPGSCYLRLNRYPPCTVSKEVKGMIPHTDSDFLTILHQDQVGGLQVKKGVRWVGVSPNPGALILIIGDLFQAWSDEEYKSVEHRVVSNPKIERFSMAYFFCPSYDSVIESHRRRGRPPVYRGFSFGEYRQKVEEDVKTKGSKVGLSGFLMP